MHYIKNVSDKFKQYARFLYFGPNQVYTKHQSDMFPRAAICFQDKLYKDVYNDIDNKMTEARMYHMGNIIEDG